MTEKEERDLMNAAVNNDFGKEPAIPMIRADQHKRIAAFLTSIADRWQSKNQEYAVAEDAYRNFHDGAALLGVTPEMALFVWMAKHLVSVRRMVERPDDYPLAVWREKCGDIIAYTAILYAMREAAGKGDA